jgi:hypothetical protein
LLFGQTVGPCHWLLLVLLLVTLELCSLCKAHMLLHHYLLLLLLSHRLQPNY